MQAMVLTTALLLPTLIPFVLGAPGQGSKPKPPVKFNGVEFVHRYTKGDLHEYTPKNQPDLKKWTDMFTINDYPKVTDGEGLASTANAVLENYKGAKAMVVRTNSLPRTATKPAEHLIVVLFPQPTFIEAAFTRLVMNGKQGASLVYSHRIYGAKAGDPMSKWLSANGEKIEKALMAMPIPKH